MLVLFLREKRIEKKSNNAESETIPERETIPEQKKPRPVLKDKREGGGGVAQSVEHWTLEADVSDSKPYWGPVGGVGSHLTSPI